MIGPDSTATPSTTARHRPRPTARPPDAGQSQHHQCPPTAGRVTPPHTDDSSDRRRSPRSAATHLRLGDSPPRTNASQSAVRKVRYGDGFDVRLRATDASKSARSAHRAPDCNPPPSAGRWPASSTPPPSTTESRVPALRSRSTGDAPPPPSDPAPVSAHRCASDVNVTRTTPSPCVCAHTPPRCRYGTGPAASATAAPRRPPRAASGRNAPNTTPARPPGVHNRQPNTPPSAAPARR